LQVQYESGILHDTARTQITLGRAYTLRICGDREANQEKAIKWLSVSLAVWRRQDPNIAVSILCQLGLIYRELGRSESAIAAWREALGLRERLLSQRGSLERRGDVAQRSRGLSAILAHQEALAGEHAAAAETLERGCAVVLRQALGLDSVWLAALPAEAQAPIRVARARLAGLSESRAMDGVLQNSVLVCAREAELDRAEAELLAALQAAGLAPLPSLDATGLAALASPGGAVVLLALTEFCGLASLFPHRCSGGVHNSETLFLPRLAFEVLRTLAMECDAAGAILQERLQSGEPLGLGQLTSVNAALEELLRGLWRMVMGPVLARLFELGVQPGAELVLMPQGVLATLPLHAALDDDGRAVLDDYVVRYAPSGMVLKTAMERLAQRQARGALDARGRGHDLFGVFNPMRGTKHALPNTERVEMPALQQQFEMLGQQARVYAGPDASHDQVLTGAATAGYVHFATHGRFDENTPQASGVQLADNRWLTVREIIAELRLDGCRLVALSACETAMVDMQHQPDEYVGLPAAFLQAGAPGVLATF
jgi:hypothetical protein